MASKSERVSSDCVRAERKRIAERKRGEQADVKIGDVVVLKKRRTKDDH